jgi:hypothetical protein
MMHKHLHTVLLVIMLATYSCAWGAELSHAQLKDLFQQANEAFRQGNVESDPTQQTKHYQKAILTFEKIIDQGQIKNPKLYYNLGNACLLNDQLGKAILNYCRAERLAKFNSDIHKNLAFARSRRLDQVSIETEKKVLQTLFFWHYDIPLAIRFTLGCIGVGITCITGVLIVLRDRQSIRFISAGLFLVVSLALFASVVWELKTLAQSAPGVITADSVMARQGDGPNYPPSFKDPLHSGTEFELLEKRSAWLHIQLSDGSSGWIPDEAGDMI